MMVKYCTINEATITKIKSEGILTVKLISLSAFFCFGFKYFPVITVTFCHAKLRQYDSISTILDWVVQTSIKFIIKFT